MARRPWDRAAREERQWRLAFEAVRTEQRLACRDLLAAIVSQAVTDLRIGHGADLETAVLYFVEADGELERWHGPELGLDVQAVRERAKALLVDRFGPGEAALLWATCSRLVGRRGRRAA